MASLMASPSRDRHVSSGSFIKDKSELDGAFVEDECPVCKRVRDVPATSASLQRIDTGYYVTSPGAACSERCLTALMEKRGVPERYAGLSLDAFQAYNPSLHQKLDFVQRWLGGDKGTGLLLTGKCGTGKTHLAVAAMRELVKAGEHAGFIGATAFAMKCQAAFSGSTTPDAIISKILHHRFIALDDLGAEKPTEFVRACLFALVDGIYTKNRTLIATSNLSLQSLHENDPRMTSRLVEICDSLEFDGEDYRLKIAQGRRAGAP
jgi:DNA replication protein DnaC